MERKEGWHVLYVKYRHESKVKFRTPGYISNSLLKRETLFAKA